MMFLKGPVRRVVVRIQARQATGVEGSRGWAGDMACCCQLGDAIRRREAKRPCRSSLVGLYVRVHGVDWEKHVVSVSKYVDRYAENLEKKQSGGLYIGSHNGALVECLLRWL